MPNLVFTQALERLRSAIATLPNSIPEAHFGGIVYRSFKTVPSAIPGDPWAATSHAYIRCFTDNPKLGSGKHPVDNVLRGKYGMDCILVYFGDFVNLSAVLNSNLPSLVQITEHITSLVHERARLAGAKPGEATRADWSNHRESVHNPEHERNDRTYIPKRAAHQSSSSSSVENFDGTDDDISTDSDKEAQSHRQSDQVRASDELYTTRRGPKDKVRKWAFSNFEIPTAGVAENGRDPAWIFKCIHCGNVRRLPRTPKCKIFAHEPKRISASNLASHLRKQCPAIPQAESWEAARLRYQQAKDFTALETTDHSLGARFATGLPIPAPPPTALSPTIFRSALIAGLVRDSLTMSFGEGEGMREVFRLANPLVTLPSHQTARRDLDKLYNILVSRLEIVMKEQTSRVAVTSNAWSSKSSVYSLAGVAATFIDQYWTLQEIVLDVVHLAAEHSGEKMGEKIYRSLDRRHVARNMVASVTDNGSNNQTMNQEIARRASRKASGHSLNAKNMSILCLCHGLHRVCSAILSDMSVCSATDDEDGFDVAKSFNLSERVEDSEEVKEEEARMRNKHTGGEAWVPDDASDGDLDDSEPGGPQDKEEVGVNVENDADNGDDLVDSEKHRENELNPAQKIHAIAVSCTSSPQRRNAMHGFIYMYCSAILAVIKSMSIRWNTVLAELRRAVKLRPAFDYYVSTLDAGKTRGPRRIAERQKKMWMMSDSEWTAIEELISVLEPFEAATLSFSQRGKIHLPNVLPTYMRLQDKLQESRDRLVKRYGLGDRYGLLRAISAGQKKLVKYFDLARQSDLTLLASILHPGMRLKYFDNEQLWGDLRQRGQVLLEYLFEVYRLEPGHSGASSSNAAQPTRPTLGKTTWSDELLRDRLGKLSISDGLDDELDRFFGNIYALQPGMDVLQWWKEHESDFPILSRIARDYIGIPATSVSVERLFSQCKFVMSDYRTMSVETARRIITCQHWLRAGLGTNLPNFVSSDHV